MSITNGPTPITTQAQIVGPSRSTSELGPNSKDNGSHKIGHSPNVIQYKTRGWKRFVQDKEIGEEQHLPNYKKRMTREEKGDSDNSTLMKKRSASVKSSKIMVEAEVQPRQDQ